MRENSKQENLKIIFSLISIFLMVPPLVNSDGNYYRTLFIFLINRVIDMFFKDNKDSCMFFSIWALVNQWSGVVACAIAFCSLDAEFMQLCITFSVPINITLFVSAASCVLREMFKLVIVSAKEKLINNKIKSDFEERGKFI